MKLRSISIISCWAVAFAFGLILNASAQEPVRPTGVPEAVAKPSPAQVAATQSGKKKPARLKTVRKTPKPLDTSETSPLVSRDVPSTGARAASGAGRGTGVEKSDPAAAAAAAVTGARITRGERVRRWVLATPDTNLKAPPEEEDLLRALLVKSPNDVARCLARDSAGSVEAFAASMNQRARELGATQSHFVNPNGLPVPGQYSTARDLSIIARAAYANPTIRSIVCMPQLVFRYANGRTRELENTNKVLRRSPYCNGMKTGYTEAAGHCLIASGSRPGRDIIVVVLGDSKAGVWRDASALLSWGLWM